LLHPLIVEELQLEARGFRWITSQAELFVPFEDGSSLQLWDDEERCAEEIRRFSPGDLAGWRAMSGLMSRVRDALRPEGDRDLWIGPAPSDAEIEARLGGDADAKGLIFEWSMRELVERYFGDERLQMAWLGQGVIGTCAPPSAPGTASIYWHHASGRMGGLPGAWGYVEGGMGRVSFMLADAAMEAGALVAAGVPVARILPGEGVELAAGERLRAPAVISNADPRTTLGLLGDAADGAWRERVGGWPLVGCTVKVNVALTGLPSFSARPGAPATHHTGQVNTPLTKPEWETAFAAAAAGGLPERLWTELYFQTAHDPGVAPEGRHVMSVFAQYVPGAFAEGSWDTRRDEVGRLALASIGRFCDGLESQVVALQVMGPPDIEAKVGLAGGHIFQGECLPEYMWSRRLTPRTPMPGVYLCGASTHPGGSVIGINGRNAAMQVLEDVR
jgi:phytoene dehydrogenase-like protein